MTRARSSSWISHPRLLSPPGPVIRPARGAVPVAYGKHDGRQSALSLETFDNLAVVYRLRLPDRAADPDAKPWPAGRNIRSGSRDRQGRMPPHA
jgi:hypothetical protein